MVVLFRAAELVRDQNLDWEGAFERRPVFSIWPALLALLWLESARAPQRSRFT